VTVLKQAELRAPAARGVQVPAYDRDRVAIGVVHFGPGAFHRAHQDSCKR
jgi:mannitol-1-phosphate/altronate dehydrogenase